jgi:hypothetical protein
MPSKDEDTEFAKVNSPGLQIFSKKKKAMLTLLLDYSTGVQGPPGV